MSSTSNNQYYRESLGSLTGFDQLTLTTPPSTNPLEYGWSIEQLRQFLLNKNEQFFPSKDWVISVENEIDSHIANLSNPHQVTVDQVSTNFVDQILSTLVPGTVPITAPFYAYNSRDEIPIGDIFPATYTTSNAYRLTNDGYFVNPANETEKPGTDFTGCKGGLPLFSTYTNLVSSSWETQTSTSVNTTLTVQNVSPLKYTPTQMYTVAENDINGLFGVSIPATETANQVYTLSVFLQSTGISGVVKVQQPNDSTNYVIVSLDTGSFVASTTAVQAVTTRYSNGIIRLTFSYTTSSTPDNAVNLTFYDMGTTIGVRDGLPNRKIFSIGYPTISQSALNAPIPIDMTQAVGTQTLVPTANLIMTQGVMGNFMIDLTLWMYPGLPVTSFADSNILTFGTLTITRDQTYIYVKSNGTLMFTTAVLPGLNRIALSYSATAIIFKDSINPRGTVTGTFPGINTSSISLGPCGGYLLSHAIYSVSDNNYCLEFLVNG